MTKWFTAAIGTLVIAFTIMLSVLDEQDYIEMESFLAWSGYIGTILGTGAAGAYGEKVRQENKNGHTVSE